MPYVLNAEPGTLLQYLGSNLVKSVKRGILRLHNFQLRNRRCRVCNNLDPEGHPDSILNDRGWRLSILDFPLSRLYRSGTRRRRGYQFCLLLAIALVVMLPEAERLDLLLLQAGEPIQMFVVSGASHSAPDTRRLEI